MGHHDWEDNPFSALNIEAGRSSLGMESSASYSAAWHVWLRPLTAMALILIIFYRVCIPNRWKRKCIYTPTCSAYTLQAIAEQGVLRGIAAGKARIRRCDGLRYRGGFDPVHCSRR